MSNSKDEAIFKLKSVSRMIQSNYKKNTEAINQAQPIANALGYRMHSVTGVLIPLK